jgi:hypothetical protein
MSDNEGAFSCGNGHRIIAVVDGKTQNLEGCFCPLCLGQVKGFGDIIDSRILAPVQEPAWNPPS